MFDYCKAAGLIQLKFNDCINLGRGFQYVYQHCISKEHFSSVEIGVEKYHYLKFPMTTKLH